MTTFVLIHAAFHGDWVWRGVSAELMGMGHKVIVPRLTAGRVGNEATLSSYVVEILRLLSHAQQEEVVVVAQSYGGLVATAVAARMPSRISCLIYVDAVLPEHGKSMLETVPHEFSNKYRDRISIVDGMDVVIPSRMNSNHLHDKVHRELISTNLTSQSLASFTEPVDLMKGGDPLASIPRQYIHCSVHSIAGAADLYNHFAQSAASNRTWRYRRLPIGFYGLLDAPQSLAASIVEAVDGVIGGLSPRCLQRVLDAIDGDTAATFPLVELARISGLSPWHFARSFKKSMGISPHAYLNKRKIERAAEFLNGTDLTIGDVALMSGFGSASRFSVAFRAATGVTPNSFRKNDS